MSSGLAENSLGCSGHRNNGCITPELGDGQSQYGAVPAFLDALRSSTGRARTRTENGNRAPQTGGVRRSGGSNMACSHAAGCPLFPLLRASLQGWRDYYCDSEDRWRDCARYQLSLTGERVPITLLPNGHHALHLRAEADAGRSGAANSSQAPRQAPPSQPDSWSPETASGSQPAPARSPEPYGPGTAAPESTAHWETAPFETAPPPPPTWHHQPSPHAQFAQPADHSVRYRRQAPSSKRGWWARLADWMRGPV